MYRTTRGLSLKDAMGSIKDTLGRFLPMGNPDTMSASSHPMDGPSASDRLQAAKKRAAEQRMSRKDLKVD